MRKKKKRTESTTLAEVFFFFFTNYESSVGYYSIKALNSQVSYK